MQCRRVQGGAGQGVHMPKPNFKGVWVCLGALQGESGLKVARSVCAVQGRPQVVSLVMQPGSEQTGCHPIPH